MSGGGGSSSSDWRGRGDGVGGGDDNKCAIVERTILASPVPALVATLSVGDLLSVQLEVNPRKRVVVKNRLGQVVGAITSVRLVDIIECLESGFSYDGQVTSISGGRVGIEIRPHA